MLIDYIWSLQIDNQLLVADIKIHNYLVQVALYESTYSILLYPFSMTLKYHFIL